MAAGYDEKYAMVSVVTARTFASISVTVRWQQPKNTKRHRFRLPMMWWKNCPEDAAFENRGSKSWFY